MLRRVMGERAGVLKALAGPRQSGGDGRGWDYANRRRRYRSLAARSR